MGGSQSPRVGESRGDGRARSRAEAVRIDGVLHKGDGTLGRLVVYVESRGADLTAVTALETLRGSLNYGGLLAGLGRADLWTVSAVVESSALDELAEELVNRTSVFVNPNKHMWRVRIEGRAADEKIKCGAWALVWDSEETHGRRALAELRGAGFEGKVERVSKATLWRLAFSGDAGGREEDLAREIAVARGRDSGLLANPHIHRWACGAGPFTLSEAIDCLDENRRGT